MICRKCGKEVNETDKFCEHCGNNLTRKTFAEILKQYKRRILVIFIVFVAILVGLLSYQYYDSHKKFVNPYYKNLAKIGAYLNQDNGKVIITDFVKDSTSDKSDLQKGDIIVKIDGKKIDNLSLSQVITLLQGQVGSKVKIQVLRNNKKIIVPVQRGNIEEYYDYYYSGQSVYTKYLKYDNGRYYFWLMQLPDDSTNFGVKNCAYARAMLIIDIKNQKIGYQQVDYYDSKHNIIKSENYADKSGKVELEDIKPNSKGYSLYEMIKRIDDNSSDREKEQFKGFLE